jgi:hypothetical protein
MYTMNRCLLAAFKFASLLMLGVSTSLSAQGQLSEPLPVNEVPLQTGVPGLRKFPDKALRGRMRVTQAPEILIDGKPERLSPGSRIRDTQQRIVMSASITNVEFVVNFLRNPLGEVQEVWLLTEAEARQRIKTNTPATNFSFASDGDSKKLDDGKTPFNQLPVFDQKDREQREQLIKR